MVLTAAICSLCAHYLSHGIFKGQLSGGVYDSASDLRKDNTDKVVEYVKECAAMGISVLPPDVNHSYAQFTVENNPPSSSKRGGD